jgi:hypothetical protein
MKDSGIIKISTRYEHCYPLFSVMDLYHIGKKLHNEELHNLYSSPSKIRKIKSRRIRWAAHVAQMGAKRHAYRILVRKPEGKRLLGSPRCR